MIIAIGNDHDGVALKNSIKEHLINKGYEVLDLGIQEGEKIDYPLMGEMVGKTVVEKKADLGIAICGTGIGISIGANKVNGVIAACCSEPYSAKLSRQHNNSNVLCFGARVVGDELAKMMVDEWLEAEFLGDRHARRVAIFKEIEESHFQTLIISPS